MLSRLVVSIMFVLLLVEVSSPTAVAPVRNVGILDLLNKPREFDGQVVAVVGFLDMSRDGDLLYLHEDDSANWILADAVWINRTEQMGKDRGLLNRKYIKVIGVFKVGYREQLGYPPNGFAEVQSAKVWSDPASPIGRKHIPGVNAEP